MKTSQIPHTDLLISRIGYGCAGLVGWDKTLVSTDEINKASRVIHTAYEHGITLFDHANLYAFGKSEATFGEVLKRVPGLRDKIVIQSKCGQSFPEDWQPGSPVRVDLSHEGIVRSVEGSLKRLATDYLDILLLHLPDALMEPQDVAAAFDELHRAGKVRYFGVSNHTAAQIQVLKECLRQPLPHLRWPGVHGGDRPGSGKRSRLYGHCRKRNARLLPPARDPGAGLVAPERGSAEPASGGDA
jgi:predicted oxidoreductase